MERTGSNIIRVVAGTILIAALLFVPAPILPPHRLAEAMQSMFGIGWQEAYLMAAISSRGSFYGVIGVLAVFVVPPAPTRRGRSLQIAITPLVLVFLALAIRSAKMGHLPVWINVVIPITGCLVGVALGAGMLHRRLATALWVVVASFGAVIWGLSNGNSSTLRFATQAHLKHIVEVSEQLPAGEARFGALLQAAFATLPTDSSTPSAIQRNRAAILAWGVAAGHPRLALLVGLDPNSELVRRAATLQQGTTLHGHEDWARHYALSAALAVVENPLISDAGGLLKEELDALAPTSGFSFADLAADRAGVRFAVAATKSETAAIVMRERVITNFVTDNFFPPNTAFPENLTVEQFRRDFGSIGSKKYRVQLSKIENQLDSCGALSPASSTP